MLLEVLTSSFGICFAGVLLMVPQDEKATTFQMCHFRTVPSKVKRSALGPQS